MASDDLKRFLAERTGVPAARWKRLTKTNGTNGAAVRLFEDRTTGRRVLTSELLGAFSVLADSHQATPDGTTSDAPGGHRPTAPTTDGPRFAVVLCEDPSMEDAMEELLENDPSFDPSYRWLTTLRLDSDARTADPAMLARLHGALPGYLLTPPGTQAAWSFMLFDDLILVCRQDGATGSCTSERDRQDVVQRLQADGWTFDPLLGDAYSAPNGVVPAVLKGPIATWRPGMVLPEPGGHTFVDAQEDPATTGTPSKAPARSGRTSHPGVGEDRRFAVVLCEDFSFDAEAVLEDDPGFDLSYGWFTTLMLGSDERTADPAVIAQLREAVPDLCLVDPGIPVEGMTFDNLIFVFKPTSNFGMCTCEAERQDLVKRLEAHGWTFDPTIGDSPDAEADGNGPDDDVPPEEVIVNWRPGMALPRRSEARPGDAPLGPVAMPLADMLRRMGFPVEALGDEDDDDDFPLLGLFAIAPRGLGPRHGEPDQPALRSRTVSPDAARFAFLFGENAGLDPNDPQREWLEIYDREAQDGTDDHVEPALNEAGVHLPAGLSEVMEGTFDYRMGDPDWTREDLFPLLQGLGMTWDRERCALAASGFDPDRDSTPWWRRGL